MTNSIKCPHCGAERIQMVVSGAVNYWSLVGRDSNGDLMWEMDSSEGDVETRYECAECGMQIAADGEQELIAILDNTNEDE